MEKELHGDPAVREEIMGKYLARKLDLATATAFEDHYVWCQDCFEELRAAELLIAGLGPGGIELTYNQDVTVLRFAAPTELTRVSLDLRALIETVHIPGEKKVLIDLSQVSRIDSAGLGMLMQCYTHAVKNAGMIKLLNPTTQVRRVLSMTRIDSVVPTFDDETAALRSF